MNDTPSHRTDFMSQLYHRYASDLRRVRTEQRDLYRRISTPLFDDVEGEWLYLLTRHLGSSQDRPVCALEIGSGSGFSTSWMLHAMRDMQAGHLTSVDIQTATNKNLPSRLTHPYWTFHQQDVMTCVAELPNSVDLLLVDSNHDSPAVEQILDAMLPRVRPGGFGCVHDIYMLPQPRQGEAVHTFVAELPDSVDLLLVDSNHDSPAVEQILDAMLPRVRPGGFGCVHDIYMLPQPRQGEAVHTFKYLEALGIAPFTPSHCFPDAWQAIQQVRTVLQLGETIHPSNTNPLLLFHVPEDREEIERNP